MKIKNHLLKGGPGESIKWRESPNHGGPLSPDSVIIHYTAGGDAESAIDTLCDPASKASAHLVVGRDGSITQLVPFNVIAWHAGQSSYNGRTGYNKYAIGIEIDNAGLLTKSGDVYISWFGRAYEEREVYYGVHRNETVPKYWHRYTEEQITIVQELCSLFIQEYGITSILGHEEISPNRKIDPGPAFPLDKMRDRLLQSDRNLDGPEIVDFPKPGVVTASALNIRSGPGQLQTKIARPLPRGTKVKILKAQNGWYNVAVEMKGWVSGDYIDVIKES